MENLDKEIRKGLIVLLWLEKGNMTCLEKETEVTFFLKSDEGGEKDEVDSLDQRDNHFKKVF